MVDNKTQQVEIAEALQLQLLQWFKDHMESEQMTATDRATLARLLMQNGWTIDPAKLPEELRNKLTTDLRPEDFDDEEQTPSLRIAR